MDKPLRVCIVDDEPLARQRLRAQLAEMTATEVIAEAGDGIAALAAITVERPDVVLLDIRMPGMGGLEVAQHLAKSVDPPAVIFTTAYDEHALAAFDANAIDYLLKPVRGSRLARALAKARVVSNLQLQALSGATGRATRTHLSGVVHGDLVLVALEDILYFQADQGYVDVVWRDGSVTIEESLRSLEAEFESRFLRVHRNALVAIAHIAGLRRASNGNHYVTLRASDKELLVSRRLLAHVRQALR